MVTLISIKNLTKKYALYPYLLARLKEALHPYKKKYHKDFYALNNVSFDVNQGEILGIIGKNGAGKSTLLKILSGLLTQSSGTAVINGRVSSLLDLTVGFNPELTGIENIYFKAAILGFNKKQIDANLEKIISFADIGDFVYQQIKTYSSGMLVRLAFAVAIHVDPKILIIDEVLAVGDAGFQRKCFEKIDDFKKSNKTIIFVSHSVELVKTFCSRVIVLDSGNLIYDGTPFDAVLKYNQLLFSDGTSGASNLSKCNLNNLAQDYPEPSLMTMSFEKNTVYGSGLGAITGIIINGLKAPNIFHGGEHLVIEIKYQLDVPAALKKIAADKLNNNIIVGFELYNKQNIVISGFNTFVKNVFLNVENNMSGSVQFDVLLPFLVSGEYYISPTLVLGSQDNYHIVCWSEKFVELKCVSEKHYVFGLQMLDYTVSIK